MRSEEEEPRRKQQSAPAGRGKKPRATPPSPPADSAARAPTNDQYFTSLYGVLRTIAGAAMRNQSPAHTLQPTALINEVFLKLSRRGAAWESRSHFLVVAARAMRCVLVDHARTRSRRKRSALGCRIALDAALSAYRGRSIDVVALDDALQRLAKLDSRAAHIVELRFFGGLSPTQVSEALGIPKRTVERDWQWARIWLHAALS